MSAPTNNDGLDDDLAELEASDPQVRSARERLDATVSSILGRRPTPHLDAVKAELRRTQEAYAASQADLTAARADGDRIAMRLVDERVARNLAEAELVSVRTELKQLRARLAESTDKEQTK